MMVSTRELRGRLQDDSVSSRLPCNGSYLLQMEQHSGNLYFSLEALGYFSQNLRIGYSKCCLQFLRLDALLLSGYYVSVRLGLVPPLAGNSNVVF